MDKRVVFFGSMDFSRYVLEELLRAGLPTQAGTEASQSADVFVMAGYGTILKKETLRKPKYGVLNVHPSLLPRYRGPSPIQQTILNEEKETGVSIILTDKKIDHGPIVAQRKIKIKNPNFKELERTLGILGGRLLAEILPKWIAGEITPLEQDHDAATYTPIIKKTDGRVDLRNDSPETIDRKLRAYAAWPGVYFEIIRRGVPFRVQIRAGHLDGNAFVIERVKPESKREMTWEEFLRGYRLDPE